LFAGEGCEGVEIEEEVKEKRKRAEGKRRRGKRPRN
jgi:hypothetical protein